MHAFQRDFTCKNVRMTNTLPACPECASNLTYESGHALACPMCGHEWTNNDDTSTDGDAGHVIRDAVGNVLSDGDTVTVIKDLKVKGASQPIKVGTKVRGIRLVDGVGDHDIECRIDGFGSMQLKSSVVKKA
jgi:protein PhnA